MEMSIGLTLRTTSLIEDCDRQGIPVPTTPQDTAVTLLPAPKLFKDNCRIDFSQSAEDIVNFVRGLSPYPAAWCNLTIHGQLYENVKVFRVRKGEGAISVPCADGTVSIEELQLPGKKRMDAKSLLNGIH
jgi:methionyl-tRNA formyltransferase